MSIGFHQRQLSTPQGRALAHGFQVAVELLHEKIGGFVIHLPEGGDNRRGAGVDKRPGEADDFLLRC